MNRASGDYFYKGFHIRASEYYNEWIIQPSYGEEDPEGVKWQRFCNNEYIVFKKLKECKDWCKTEAAQNLRNKYLI